MLWWKVRGFITRSFQKLQEKRSTDHASPKLRTTITTSIETLTQALQNDHNTAIPRRNTKGSKNFGPKNAICNVPPTTMLVTKSSQQLATAHKDCGTRTRKTLIPRHAPATVHRPEYQGTRRWSYETEEDKQMRLWLASCASKHLPRKRHHELGV